MNYVKTSNKAKIHNARRIKQQLNNAYIIGNTERFIKLLYAKKILDGTLKNSI